MMLVLVLAAAVARGGAWRARPLAAPLRPC
jgi:hypothetical protein